jgi:bifunctional ADP-heptose synthase (sugar kinase/adenylyltransferase)
LLTQSENWQTHVYAKPQVAGREQNRFDFGSFNQIDEKIERALVDELGSILSDLDLVVICQQVKRGIWSERMKRQLTELIARNSDKIFLVDGRDLRDEFAGTYRKLNEREAFHCWAAITGHKGQDQRHDLEEMLVMLYQRWGGPICLTRGAEGALLMSDAGLEHVDGIELSVPLDIVGAGDSVLAGMAAALASGAGFLEACELGNLCAAVTIQKIGQTGTAAPQEILELEE